MINKIILYDDLISNKDKISNKKLRRLYKEYKKVIENGKEEDKKKKEY